MASEIEEDPETTSVVKVVGAVIGGAIVETPEVKVDLPSVPVV